MSTCWYDIQKNACTRVANCLCAHERVILVSILPSCEATLGISTKTTLEWAQKQFVTRVHTLYYFLYDIKNQSMAIKTTIFTHRPRISFARFTFYWWHHNRLRMTSQWPDSYDASTWHMISNSIDLGFIYANIHDQSRKKFTFFPECPIQGEYLFVGPYCISSNWFRWHGTTLKMILRMP